MIIEVVVYIVDVKIVRAPVVVELLSLGMVFSVEQFSQEIRQLVFSKRCHSLSGLMNKLNVMVVVISLVETTTTMLMMKMMNVDDDDDVRVFGDNSMVVNIDHRL